MPRPRTLLIVRQICANCRLGRSVRGAPCQASRLPHTWIWRATISHPYPTIPTYISSQHFQTLLTTALHNLQAVTKPPLP